jgi:hypothetical protein
MKSTKMYVISNSTKLSARYRNTRRDFTLVFGFPEGKDISLEIN